MFPQVFGTCVYGKRFPLDFEAEIYSEIPHETLVEWLLVQLLYLNVSLPVESPAITKTVETAFDTANVFDISLLKKIYNHLVSETTIQFQRKSWAILFGRTFPQRIGISIKRFINRTILNNFQVIFLSVKKVFFYILVTFGFLSTTFTLVHPWVEPIYKGIVTKFTDIIGRYRR